MERTDFPYNDLLRKYIDGTITQAESDNLFGWLQENNAGAIPELESILENTYRRATTASPQITSAASNEIWQKLSVSLENRAARRVHFLKTGWFRYAAVFLLLIGAAAFLYLNNRPQRQIAGKSSAIHPADIFPGTNKVVLTLSDGGTILLDTATNRSLGKQGSTNVLQLDAGSLAYQPGTANNEVVYNKISTPKGRQFRVVLADGSNVWLNAASSIRFPTAFKGADRSVEITGEAYFEVTPDNAKPFKVITNDVEVDVLGTHFNVNSYENEKNIKTTLLEGSVRVVKQASQEQVMLNPGQQAWLGRGSGAGYKAGHFNVVNNIDISKVVAWKNGLFDFNGVDIEELMRQIERWYDIEVVYENGVPDMEFVGKINRNSSLSTLLKALESTNVRFRIEGRRIIVLP